MYYCKTKDTIDDEDDDDDALILYKASPEGLKMKRPCEKAAEQFQFGCRSLFEQLVFKISSRT